MGRKIAIVSGKGGVGKTTIVAGIGKALARKGASVCLIDMDVGLNNLDVLLNCNKKVNYDVVDCVKSRVRIKQALICDNDLDNLYFLSCNKEREFDDINYKDFVDLTDKLASVFDFVIIDSPAGKGEAYKFAVLGANEIIVVATPHIVSIRDADKLISGLKGLNKENIKLVINRIRGDLVMSKQMLSHDEVQSLIRIPLLGVVPESDQINIFSSLKFDNINEQVACSFNILARNLRYDKPIIYDYKSRYKGVLGLIRRHLKRSV